MSDPRRGLDAAARPWLVAWNDASDVHGARFSGSGAVLDPSGITLSSAPNIQSLPQVAYNGAEYWAVWQDERTTAGHQDIYGARISTAGTVLDPSGLVISTNANDQLSPAITGGPYREALTTYHRIDSASPYADAVRVFARILEDFLPDGASCAVTGDCTSGFCVDGVCCTTACSGTCQGCSNATTGLADGTCGTVTNGTDPGNSCPSTGVTCATSTCQSGACAETYMAGSCLIGGACYASAGTDPSDACQACEPAQSQTAWTPITGCVLDAGAGDAGAGDAGAEDGGSVDAGSGDAGTDAGTTTGSGGADGGTSSSTTSSSSTSSGAGGADAGTTSSGAGGADAGTTSSSTTSSGAGGTDAGTTSATGTGGGSSATGSGTGGEVGAGGGSSGGTPATKGGCSCRVEGTTEGGSTLPFAVFAAAIALSRRRRMRLP